MSTREATLAIPADTAAIGRARRFTAAFLEEQGAGELIDTVVLMVSELVTNALLHSGASAQLRLLLTDSGLRAEVRDTSPATPFVKQYSETATTGRGMVIVDALAKSWGANTDASGKVVWFTVDVDLKSGHRLPAGARARTSRRTSGSSASGGYQLFRRHRVGRPVVCEAGVWL